jgi:hypothetical protein
MAEQLPTPAVSPNRAVEIALACQSSAFGCQRRLPHPASIEATLLAARGCNVGRNVGPDGLIVA